MAWCPDVLADKPHPWLDTKILSKKTAAYTPVFTVYVFTCKTYFLNKSQSNSVLVVNIHIEGCSFKFNRFDRSYTESLIVCRIFRDIFVEKWPILWIFQEKFHWKMINKKQLIIFIGVLKKFCSKAIVLHWFDKMLLTKNDGNFAFFLKSVSNDNSNRNTDFL